jgi:hyperosmotically inducible protein
MKKPQLFTSAIVMALAATAACNRAETSREAREAAAGVRTVAARAGDKLADGWLTAKVQAKYFAEDDIKARYIDVSTRDGTVTLKGFVENDAQRQQALLIAKNTEGVKQVEDRLLIGQAPATASAASSSGAVATSGSNAAPMPAGETSLDDSMVVSLIQARYFVDPGIKTRSIEVLSAGGVVTLRGQVASDHERAQALLLARTSQGVQRVEDGLTVDASLGQPAVAASTQQGSLPAAPIPGAAQVAPSVAAAAPGSGSAANARGPATSAAGSAAVGTSAARPVDTTLEGSLKTKLAGDAQLKAAKIDVSARDGVVMLQGTAATQAAKQRALKLARETEGVTQVVDRITVGKR